MPKQIKRALISVSDKTGVMQFARGLHELGIEILSTGGTYKYLVQNSIPAIEVASITGFPEIMDGRVKTLHPNIHGAILAVRDNKNHMEQLKQHGIVEIDLVCVNLYPFADTINKPNSTLTDAIENIDIGGPAMIRSSSKNYQHIVIVTSPDDYVAILEQILNSGKIDSNTRLVLAQKAFSHTAYYDSLISEYLGKQLSDNIVFPKELTIQSQLVQTLRYGENPHQQAAFYKDSGAIDGLIASFKQIQGKELSYNNLSDSDAAWECVRQFQTPACVIVKHSNPCGVALGADALDCYQKAFSSDPISSFGGIIAFNTCVDAQVAHVIAKQFLEVLIAPNYTADAKAILAKKTNVRVLEIKLVNNNNRLEYKRIGGGVLIQTPENKILDTEELKIVSSRLPTDTILNDLKFAWSVARFVKSNAIVLVKNGQTIGIGAGQMSRIDSSKIAMTKAREFGFDITNSVGASDAFFPFRDNIDLLAKGGVRALIQPGGSIRDNEIFVATDELDMCMVLTGYRTFRH